MELALTDDHATIAQVARDLMGDQGTLERARSALDDGGATSVWRSVADYGWAGLLATEEGGDEPDLFPSLLTLREAGRVLADTGLVGHLPAAYLVQRAGFAVEVESGGTRLALLAGDAAQRLRVEQRNGGWVASGSIRDATDAAGAGILVVVANDRAFAVEKGRGVTVSVDRGYDATRGLAQVTFDGAPVKLLDVPSDTLTRAEMAQQALLGAEALGAAEACLDMARRYALDRVAFGRAIGSYQAIKHQLVELLRLGELARSHLDHAAWAWASNGAAFHRDALALRIVADDALYRGARQNIFIHGAIGVTWELDASLYYRRAEVTRRLIGGRDAAARALGDLMLSTRDTAHA
jgi:alkylation response protein AidB-like acyl-CoA dehydrogenase